MYFHIEMLSCVLPNVVNNGLEWPSEEATVLAFPSKDSGKVLYIYLNYLCFHLWQIFPLHTGEDQWGQSIAAVEGLCLFSSRGVQKVAPCTAIGNFLWEKWAQFLRDMAGVKTFHFQFFIQLSPP